jgi:[ribosomal protein S18]-alanine N-acetyltransferase
LSLEVREARAADLDQMFEIACEVIVDPWSRSALAEELARKHALVLVAARGETIEGFVIVWLVADEASVLLVAVRRSAQRSGIGRVLLSAAEARARAAGMISAYLEVRASNAAARAFYRTMGYEESGLRRGYYSNGTEDAVLMRRSLT